MDTNSTRKFEEALQLLNEAAREKKDEIQGLITEKYSHIREAIEDAAVKSRRTYKRAKSEAGDWVDENTESLRSAASELDERVHDNPWAYLGGMAAGALLVGFILGSSARNK